MRKNSKILFVLLLTLFISVGYDARCQPNKPPDFKSFEQLQQLISLSNVQFIKQAELWGYTRVLYVDKVDIERYKTLEKGNEKLHAVTNPQHYLNYEIETFYDNKITALKGDALRAKFNAIVDQAKASGFKQTENDNYRGEVYSTYMKEELVLHVRMSTDVAKQGIKLSMALYKKKNP